MPPSAAANLPQLSLSVLYRGVFGSLFGQIPYGMLTFGTYEIYKAMLLSKIFPVSAPTDLQLLAVFVVAAVLGDLSGFELNFIHLYTGFIFTFIQFFLALSF